MQIHCETCQEALDSILMAYRLAEDERVLLPVFVNIDGFHLSFTREPVEIPDMAEVRKFLPPYQPKHAFFRASQPMAQGVAVIGGSLYSYFKYQMHLASMKALDVYREVSREFEKIFGRSHHTIEGHMTDDAEYVLIMSNSFATLGKAAVEKARENGMKAGLLRLRLLRPFPESDIKEALKGKRVAAVLDQNISVGRGGILHSEIAAALYNEKEMPLLLSFIGGLGGKNISVQEFEFIFEGMTCFTLLSLYPFTPFKNSWLYTAMACAPAGAQGIRDALDILIRKGRLDPEEDLKVIVLTGDGVAYDIGLASTSGALHRNLDFYYICSDNEAYGNTGFQLSGATPFSSKTGTTPIGKMSSSGALLPKKDLFEIWRSHKPPYLATISPAHPVDLINKFKKAEQYKGPKLFINLSPCPPGWTTDPSYSARLAKLAVDTGIWALKEAVYGAVTHTVIPGKFKPVEEYLKEQGRFSHLFQPVRQEEVLGKIQEMVGLYWSEVPSLSKSRRNA